MRSDAAPGKVGARSQVSSRVADVGVEILEANDAHRVLHVENALCAKLRRQTQASAYALPRRFAYTHAVPSPSRCRGRGAARWRRPRSCTAWTAAAARTASTAADSARAQVGFSCLACKSRRRRPLIQRDNYPERVGFQVSSSATARRAPRHACLSRGTSISHNPS